MEVFSLKMFFWDLLQVIFQNFKNIFWILLNILFFLKKILLILKVLFKTIFNRNLKLVCLLV